MEVPHPHYFLSGARREGSHPFFLGSKFLQSSFRVPSEWEIVPFLFRVVILLAYDESFLDTDRVFN